MISGHAFSFVHVSGLAVRLLLRVWAHGLRAFVRVCAAGLVLSDGPLSGRYQGIVVTTDAVLYGSASNSIPAADQHAVIAYSRAFHVRIVVLYCRPAVLTTGVDVNPDFYYGDATNRFIRYVRVWLGWVVVMVIRESLN